MKMYLFSLNLLWLVILVFNNAWAVEKNLHKVFAEHGNVYYVASDKTVQITHTGKDKNPSLSPDNKTIAFVRTSDILVPKSCVHFAFTSDDYANQVWIYDIATKKEKLLVKNNFLCDKLEEVIVDPEDLQFSPNSKILYFTTSAWVTSGALHAANVDGTNLRYLAPANSYQVVYNGKYKNRLIIQQHRYFSTTGEGSYDWYWLYTLQGKQIKTLGPMD